MTTKSPVRLPPVPNEVRERLVFDDPKHHIRLYQGDCLELLPLIAYLGQLMLQAQRLARTEFEQAFNDPWREVVQNAATFNLPDPPDGPAAESGSPAPTPEPLDPNSTESPGEIPPSPKIM